MKDDKGIGKYKGNRGKRWVSCVQPGLLVGCAPWARVIPAAVSKVLLFFRFEIVLKCC